MTIKVKHFGKYLITRQDAKPILEAAGKSVNLPVLDFSGVDVANHCFADELGKGLIASFELPDLSSVTLKGANSYVKNCVQAGFMTAAEI